MEKKSAYEMVTDRIIAELEKGVIPWHKPWGAANAAPRNLLTQREYSGINVLLTGMQGYACPYWLTAKQAATLGASPSEGEKPTQIVFAGYGKKTDKKTGKDSGFSFFRTYDVFNATQMDNLKLSHEVLHPDAPKNVNSPIGQAMQIWFSYPNAPTLNHGHDMAAYSPLQDKIMMPDITAFDSSEHYHATLFHEMAHSTGHKKRLNRKDLVNTAGFRSHSYSKEELTAEMTAAFLCAESGISSDSLTSSHASYLQSWLKVLRSDSKMILGAASKATKAANHILGKKGVK